jgi:hypothetical protein
MAVPPMMPPTMPSPWAVPAPPIMAPPTPIRVGIRIRAVPSPIARPPIAAPRTANEHGLFHASGGALGEPQLAGRRDRHGRGVLRRCRKSEHGRNRGSRKGPISHAFSSLASGQIDACVGIRTYPNARVSRIDATSRWRGAKIFFDRRAGVRPLFSGVNRASAGAR